MQVTPLLAAQPECSQQDMADKIIGKYSSLLSTYVGRAYLVL